MKIADLENTLCEQLWLNFVVVLSAFHYIVYSCTWQNKTEMKMAVLENTIIDGKNITAQMTSVFMKYLPCVLCIEPWCSVVQCTQLWKFEPISKAPSTLWPHHQNTRRTGQKLGMDWSWHALNSRKIDLLPAELGMLFPTHLLVREFLATNLLPLTSPGLRLTVQNCS